MEEQEENLRCAVLAYQEALEHYKPDIAPLYYASTQRNLGVTQEDMGDLLVAVDCWREAEKYYRQMGAVDRADLMRRWIKEAEGD